MYRVPCALSTFGNAGVMLCMYQWSISHCLSAEPENSTTPQMYAVRYSRRSWNSGGWTPTRWNLAAGPRTASTETHRSVIIWFWSQRQIKVLKTGYYWILGHSTKWKDLKQVVIGLYCDVLLFIVNRKTHRITFYIQKELCTKANLFHKGSLLKTFDSITEIRVDIVNDKIMNKFTKP